MAYNNQYTARYLCHSYHSRIFNSNSLLRNVPPALRRVYDLYYVGTVVKLSTSLIPNFLLSRRGFTNTAAWAMFSVTVFCFLVATLHWCATVSSFVIIMRSAMVDNIDVPLDVRQGLANAHAQTTNIIVAWTEFLVRWSCQLGDISRTHPVFKLKPVVSDAIVIWRAWVLFTEHRWIMIFPILLLLGAVGKICLPLCAISDSLYNSIDICVPWLHYTVLVGRDSGTGRTIHLAQQHFYLKDFNVPSDQRRRNIIDRL